MSHIYGYQKHIRLIFRSAVFYQRVSTLGESEEQVGISLTSGCCSFFFLNVSLPVCFNFLFILQIVRPVNAFLIVDVQNDFISGSLDISNCSAQQKGYEILEPINNLLETVDFDATFYSLDWHPSDHISFIDNVKMRPMDESSPIDADSAQVFDTVIFAGPPPMKQRLWPRHCVQDSWGAELHKDLKIADNSVKVYKGTNPEVDSYSVFWDNKKLSDTSLNAQLKLKGTTDIYVCGLAYDVCVGATAADALSVGYRTILIDDCCRGTDFHDIEHTKETVITHHGVIVHSNEVKGMAEGRDRRPELGYKLAMELKNPDSALSQRNETRPVQRIRDDSN
ncbi:nicotinamidase-like [Teleopsis dalmanni]|uniref:nicotinamidase-like n=1 Tax=Teleopsis dalmanni TaxID=139649 RepID=UPI0018CC7FD9|nr:nicotinamidase-like [Teleopsis dalmanni]